MPYAWKRPQLNHTGRVERAVLVHEHERELGLESVGVLRRREVAAEALAGLADGARERWTTWRTLVSPCSFLPWRPALRKYLETTMSVASCDQPAGISAPSILKTTEPSGFVMTLVRRSQVTVSSGSTPRSRVAALEREAARRGLLRRLALVARLPLGGRFVLRGARGHGVIMTRGCRSRKRVELSHRYLQNTPASSRPRTQTHDARRPRSADAEGPRSSPPVQPCPTRAPCILNRRTANRVPQRRTSRSSRRAKLTQSSAR